MLKSLDNFITKVSDSMMLRALVDSVALNKEERDSHSAYFNNIKNTTIFKSHRYLLKVYQESLDWIKENQSPKIAGQNEADVKAFEKVVDGFYSYVNLKLTNNDDSVKFKPYWGDIYNLLHSHKGTKKLSQLEKDIIANGVEDILYLTYVKKLDSDVRVIYWLQYLISLDKLVEFKNLLDLQEDHLKVRSLTVHFSGGRNIKLPKELLQADFLKQYIQKKDFVVESLVNATTWDTNQAVEEIKYFLLEHKKEKNRDLGLLELQIIHVLRLFREYSVSETDSCSILHGCLLPYFPKLGSHEEIASREDLSTDDLQPNEWNKKKKQEIKSLAGISRVRWQQI